MFQSITSSESMISAIRELGIVPFFKSAVPGWSVQEMTDPDCWFETSENLGPWDWKIETVRAGDILYGKFLGRKAAFASVDCYRHLMNWRRSLPQYRMALGEEYHCRTIDDRLNRLLSPVLLSAIKEYGALESGEIRRILTERVPEKVRRRVGGHMDCHR